MSEAFPGKYVKVMADFGADPVFPADGVNGDLFSLPLSSKLCDALWEWAKFYDCFCQDYLTEESRDIPSFPRGAFSDIGAFLAKKLKQELGKDWTVEYYAEDTRKTYLIEQPSNSGES